MSEINSSELNMGHLRQWLGRETRVEDTFSVRQAHLMAATVDLPQEVLKTGVPLPPLWHWIYFLEGLPPSKLGRDGHPERGGFLPPVPLANRMWAGGNVQFLADIPLGETVQKRSVIQSIEHKQGRSGDLVFVTVLHEVLHHGQVAISETHDIVYKNATPPNAVNKPAANAAPSMPPPLHSKRFSPTSTTLFRYSALTFNGHRIHYDVDYCRDVEGYRNLVIHDPLNATLLAGYAQDVVGKPIKQFRYRGLQPSVIGDELTLNAAFEGESLCVWVSLGNGAVSMRAEVWF
jgi:3-methylfumaryl-CoA hydratase